MPVLVSVSEVRISDGDYSITTTPERAMKIRDALIEMYPCSPRAFVQSQLVTSCNNGENVKLDLWWCDERDAWVPVDPGLLKK